MLGVHLLSTNSGGGSDGPSASYRPGGSKPREGWTAASTKDNTESRFTRGLHVLCMFIFWLGKQVSPVVVFCLCLRINSSPPLQEYWTCQRLQQLTSNAFAQEHWSCDGSFTRNACRASIKPTAVLLYGHCQLVTTLTGICVLEIWFSSKPLRPEITRDNLCDCICLLWPGHMCSCMQSLQLLPGVDSKTWYCF